MLAPETMKNTLSVISYNLHELNQEVTGIEERISKIEPEIIKVQEHLFYYDNVLEAQTVTHVQNNHEGLSTGLESIHFESITDIRYRHELTKYRRYFHRYRY
jgi:predicted nuclease with TOPRIM domain